MFVLYSGAVKRFVLLLLLAVLPLQMAWAAGGAHCPPDGIGGAYAPATGEAVHAHAPEHEHDHDDGDKGHAAGPEIECSAFHLVTLEPPAAPTQLLARGGGNAPDARYSGYQSHIPGGLERPKWRIAA